jgi:hypothetical protein
MLRISSFIGLAALAAGSVQAAPSPNRENWVQLGSAPSFELGAQGCGVGWHQALRRDWRGDWWWGPCVQNRWPGPPPFGLPSGVDNTSTL